MEIGNKIFSADRIENKDYFDDTFVLYVYQLGLEQYFHFYIEIENGVFRKKSIDAFYCDLRFDDNVKPNFDGFVITVPRDTVFEYKDVGRNK